MSKTMAAGGISGLAGGLVFGALMRIMPDTAARISMIDFAADAVHAADPLVGWLAYAIYGLAIGALFGWLFGNSRLDDVSALAWGAVYGIGSWVVAEIVLVPALFALWPFSMPAVARAQDVALPLLAGHVLAGAVTGFTWGRIIRWTSQHRDRDVGESSTRRAA